MKAFRYQGELYFKVIPAKSLFHSSMVHEVVNRGDIFVMRARDQALTILPGTIQVTHEEVELTAVVVSIPI